MGMNYTSGGWRVFVVDRAGLGAPMRMEEAARRDGKAISLWRMSNSLHVDMRYGGTVDVRKYRAVSTYAISGCHALAIVKLAGCVTECFFSHSTANITPYFAERGVGILGGDLRDHHAVLVENYMSPDSAKVARILIDAGLRPARLLVYTNPFKQADQTFALRFSDGLFGEVNVRSQTEKLTEPVARNKFLLGFNTNPKVKSPYEMLDYLKPATNDTFNQYMTMFTHLAPEIYRDKWLIHEDEEKKQRMREHGNAAIGGYLQRLQQEPELVEIRLYLQRAYSEYHFSVLS